MEPSRWPEEREADHKGRKGNRESKEGSRGEVSKPRKTWSSGAATKRGGKEAECKVRKGDRERKGVAGRGDLTGGNGVNGEVVSWNRMVFGGLMLAPPRRRGHIGLGQFNRKESAMERFLQRHGGQVKGVISAWDRVCFRGTLRWLASLAGLGSFLSTHRILLKDFMNRAEELTKSVREACERSAVTLGIPCEYLRSSAVDKEARAREIAEERGVTTGAICMFSVVEPCRAPSVRKDRSTKRLVLIYGDRRCVWVYVYFNDPRIGFGHLRIQTWLPFTVKICVNGRHWLERDLEREGIEYVKSANCFRAIANVGRAQELANDQLKTDWDDLLSGLMKTYLPDFRGLGVGRDQRPLQYYWSADESEWATDVMFRTSADLDRLFPMIARHAMMITNSDSIMRYLGQIPAEANPPHRMPADLRSDKRRRHEGLCVKHSHKRNSVKTYNKVGNVLRVETTINATRDFKVFRPDVKGGTWVKMRKGVADMHRRAEVSQKCNERYLQALSECKSAATVQETMALVCARQKQGNRTARAMNPWSETDRHLIEFLAKGEWALNGLRNRDLAKWLDPKVDELDETARRKLSAKATRLLGLLRAHGLIAKVPKTHRYQVTPNGHQLATLVAAASNVQISDLMEKAA